MRKRLVILLLLFLSLPFREGMGVGLFASPPPADDAYYVTGGQHRINAEQLPIVENEWNEPDTTNQCHPSITYLSVQDTVVVATIQRCLSDE